MCPLRIGETLESICRFLQRFVRGERTRQLPFAELLATELMANISNVLPHYSFVGIKYSFVLLCLKTTNQLML